MAAVFAFCSSQRLSFHVYLVVFFCTLLRFSSAQSSITLSPAPSSSAISTATSSNIPSSTVPTSLSTTSIANPSSVATTSTPAAAPPPAASTSLLSIVPSASGYRYVGCYNETTGDAAAGNVRALAGGNMTTSAAMTVPVCLNFCRQTGNALAGLEYGRECWCADILNVYAARLPDANCSLACGGDAGTACGGEWKLDIYNTSSTAGNSAAGKLEIGWGVAVAIVLGLVIAYAVLL